MFEIMINFQNPQNIEIYASFITEFGEILKEKYNEATINISGVNVTHNLASAVIIHNDPFATNIEMTPRLIVFNESICNALNLTIKERHAMISHEIGHLIDSTPKEGNEMQREMNADMFAFKLGLAKDLISGLKKIVDSGNYINEVDGIEKRLRKLASYCFQ